MGEDALNKKEIDKFISNLETLSMALIDELSKSEIMFIKHAFLKLNLICFRVKNQQPNKRI